MSKNLDTAETARTIVANFLRNTAIKKQPIEMFDADGVVEGIVRARVRVSDIAPDRYDKHLRTALAIGTTSYAHTHLDIQVHITIYTLLTTSIDDFDIPHADQFVARFTSGLPQLTPALDALADNLLHMVDFYPPYAANGIITSTLDFINATQFEKESKDFVLAEGAANYAIYTRFKNGVSQAYGLFIWDKFNHPDMHTYIQSLPDAMLCINYVNDILSFYKEELEGDYQNVVHGRATARRKDIVTELSDMVEEVIASLARCHDVLDGKEREAWDQFMSGYLTFHYLAPRYRLQEIIAL